MSVALQGIQTPSKDKRMPENTNKKNPNQIDKDKDDKQRQGQQGEPKKQGDIGKQGDLNKERKGVDSDLDEDLEKPSDE
jgi:hypothetical protein